jgi:hypothetical protein
MPAITLSKPIGKLPNNLVFLPRDLRWYEGNKLASVLMLLFIMVSPLSWFPIYIFYTLLGPLGVIGLVSMVVLLPIARHIWFGFSRKWNCEGSLTNREWSEWLDAAQLTNSVEKLPVLRHGSMSQACLLASVPKDGKTEQYQFAEPAQAAAFCLRHRQLTIQRLRSSFPDQHGERRLALGTLENTDVDCLLLFRQITDDCAVFLLVTLRRVGTVVSLITHRWALYNRDASPKEGRRKSDEEVAAKKGVSRQGKWRARPEWGTLGYWHLVDCICREEGGDGMTPPPQTSASDSELDYYEKIVQVEVIKELKGQSSQETVGTSSSGTSLHAGQQTTGQTRSLGEFL